MIQRTFETVVLVVLLGCLALAQQPPQKDYSKETARASQTWIRDAVVYQIFPRQYSAKGDFNSITNDLDRINDLGVDVIWLMPVHPIGELKKKGSIGSPYAVRDYYAVNPDYGTGADLKRLISEAHKRRIKVIIDIVANHTAWDSVMMKNPDFYTKDADGKMQPPVPDWADVADLNFDNPELRKYMIEMLKFWVREFDLDGFRCDVAGFIPTDFWETARAEVDKIKKDTFWLAEWHEPDLLVNAFDSDYSWSMHSALDDVLHGKRPASHIQETWQAERDRFPKAAIHMRFTDNHDERRAIVRFGEKGAIAGQSLVYLIDGIPLVYNGMEVGDTSESGAPALFEKIPINWGFGSRRPEFGKFHRLMIQMRKRYVSLRRGSVEWIANSEPERVLSFSRRHETEELVAVINMSSSPFRGSIEISGRFEDVTPSYTNGNSGRNAALPFVKLNAWEFRVFRRTAL
ncbi:MAG: alpha-amylase family glycosyl hydrolase [Acidobacteriota bacterium]|nr:alpha-amylase family glycosyl hydrolase [Acidobacteriota bacterium]